MRSWKSLSDLYFSFILSFNENFSVAKHETLLNNLTDEFIYVSAFGTF